MQHLVRRILKTFELIICDISGGYTIVSVDVPLDDQRAALAVAQRRAARGAGVVAVAVSPAPRRRARAHHRRRRDALARTEESNGQYCHYDEPS